MKINTNSKNFRIILFSVIGLAVLAAVVLVLTLTAPDDGSDDDQNVTETTTADPALMLQPEDKGKIESIYIENPVGSFTVKKAGRHLPPGISLSWSSCVCTLRTVWLTRQKREIPVISLRKAIRKNCAANMD